MAIFDNDPDLYFRLKDNHAEVVAYAIDHEEAGIGNELTAAIARRF